MNKNIREGQHYIHTNRTRRHRKNYRKKTRKQTAMSLKILQAHTIYALCGGHYWLCRCASTIIWLCAFIPMHHCRCVPLPLGPLTSRPSLLLGRWLSASCGVYNDWATAEKKTSRNETKMFQAKKHNFQANVWRVHKMKFVYSRSKWDVTFWRNIRSITLFFT